LKTVTGVYTSRDNALRAIEQLKALVPADNINLMSPNAAGSADVPTTKDMPPVGKYIGGALGTAVGLAVGTSLIVPGLGAITLAGTLATALFGVGGAVTGAATGAALDNANSPGIPVDELYVYKDALRKGRTVVIVQTNDVANADRVRAVMAESGAESLDAARDSWWVGIRDDTKLEYQSQGKTFPANDTGFRRGFEYALSQDKARTFDAQAAKARYPGLAESQEFRQGYEQGLRYKQGFES
jgi:hypothetical protein